MNIASVLRQQRESAGITQAALAARCGTSQATVCAYERGHKQPSVPTLERLLAACGARLAIERAPEPVVVPTIRQHDEVSRGLAEVLELAAALPTRHAPELGYPSLAGSRAA